MGIVNLFEIVGDLFKTVYTSIRDKEWREPVIRNATYKAPPAAGDIRFLSAGQRYLLGRAPQGHLGIWDSQAPGPPVERFDPTDEARARYRLYALERAANEARRRKGRRPAS
jgi:hypothetical protein